MLVMAALGNENAILDRAGRKSSVSSCKTLFSPSLQMCFLCKKIIIIILGMKYPYFSYTA